MKRRNPIYVIGRVLAIPLFKLLFFYQVNGKKNLPKEGPFIVCCNHISNWDPAILTMTQKRQIYYMAKAELFENKFFAWLIRQLGAFPVHRGAGDTNAINEAEEVVRDGRLLGISLRGPVPRPVNFCVPSPALPLLPRR